MADLTGWIAGRRHIEQAAPPLPYWCPDCDVVRLDRIDAQFEAIKDTFR